MLDVALKEWAIVCDLLLEGQMTLLLRKGGILETSGPGGFELEHRRFALLPSWAHQRPNMIKPAYRDRVQVQDEPDRFTISGLGEAVKVWRVHDRAGFDRLDDLHCWTREQVDMRFNYKPERPLYLLAVRVHRLQEPRTVQNHRDYAGCRSWVNLRPDDRMDTSLSGPVLDDSSFGRIMGRVDAALGQVTP